MQTEVETEVVVVGGAVGGATPSELESLQCLTRIISLT